VAVLSDGFWRSTSAGDRGIIGQPVLLDGIPKTVVGVMPRGFRYPGDVDLWTTISGIAADPNLKDLRIFEAIGRLKPGANLARTREELLAISRRVEQERPETNLGYTARVTPLARRSWAIRGRLSFSCSAPSACSS